MSKKFMHPEKKRLMQNLPPYTQSWEWKKLSLLPTKKAYHAQQYGYLLCLKMQASLTCHKKKCYNHVVGDFN